MFLPVDRMWERVEISKQDSDSLAFLSLLYTGEAITKIVVAGLASAIKEDRERHRYRVFHGLVRANSLGEWVQCLTEILTGPTSQFLPSEISEERLELTKKEIRGTWQYEAVDLVHKCRQILDPKCEGLPVKASCKEWFSQFTALRNRTRGHGAIIGRDFSKMCSPLERSLRLIYENLSLFKRPWVFLHQNLSGKYRVTKISETSTPFDYLKSTTNQRFNDAVYIYCDDIIPVDLIISNPDASDFFFPNGNFDGKNFELISYATDDILYADAYPYLQPSTELPPSETQGVGDLDIRGKTFTNLPNIPKEYISRQDLEKELSGVLIDDRHPVITLVGRGGIGKTWLSLSVLDQITQSDKFSCILWFSSRDIDLLPQGPKPVKPHVLTVRDVSKEFVRLVQPMEASEESFSAKKFLQNCLGKSTIGPTLFVFDNFETVENPVEVYQWLDTYIRLPNKILITTRVRDSKGDYPVEISGMTNQQFEQLIVSTATSLGINEKVTDNYKKQLFEESAGHPYVAKILLGECVKNPSTRSVKRILATRKDILDALFERTYAGLSAAARRVFLTLCNWRSAIPQLALESVLLRPEHEERIDVEQAVTELRQSSFIEVSSDDGNLFISVPLVAFQFGQGKLAVSPLNAAIQADTEILYLFGTTPSAEMKQGIKPRMKQMFDKVARRISLNREELNKYLPILEFTAKGWAPGWFLLASLYEELNSYEEAKEAIRRFLETTNAPEKDKTVAWERLAGLCQKTEDWGGEVHARIELSKLPNTPFYVISNTANRLNELFREKYSLYDTQEKRIIVQTLVDTMAKYTKEASANDFSRLAWLCLHLNDEERAKEFTFKGLELQPDNTYCQGLAETLHINV